MAYHKLSQGMSEEQARRKLERVMPQTENKEQFQGLTPPSIFIGSHNHPRVNTGVLSPQTPTKSSALMDNPKEWYKQNYTLEKIAALRTSLVNSKKKTDVKNTEKFTKNAQEIAMAKKQVNIEVKLDKKPGKNITGGRVKPVSQSANIKQFKLGENPSVERKLEKMYYDTDIKAENAVKELQTKGIDNYKIQQTFSAGMLGEKKKRELVPTRWSITATDDILSKQLRKQVQTYQELGEIQYYTNSYLGNHFHIFLIPGKWEYELIELKRPGSVWNQARNTYIAQNYEPHNGRTTYAEDTAGAFYAARLATLENLYNMKRQAKPLIIREVTPQYWAPVGVWIIRETIRNAFQKQNKKNLENMEEVKFKIGNEFKFLYKRIQRQSKLLQDRQTNLRNYLEK